MNDQNIEALRKGRPEAVQRRDIESGDAVIMLESAVEFLRKQKEVKGNSVQSVPLDVAKVMREEHESAVAYISKSQGAVSNQITSLKTEAELSVTDDTDVNMINQQIDEIFAAQAGDERNPLEGVL